LSRAVSFSDMADESDQRVFNVSEV
jgi:hypothetical protein